jgi:hypothetical protein
MNSVNVVVARKRTVQVSANATAGIIDSTTPVTLKPIPSLNVGVDRLDKLKDVIATGEANGAVPVYDSGIDKYIIKQVDLGEVTGNLDGGTF